MPLPSRSVPDPSARLSAPAIDTTAEGTAGEQLLDTYHEERHPNAVALVKTTDRIFSGFVASTRGWAGFVRRRVLPFALPAVLRRRQVQRRMFHILSQTALNYRGRTLSVDHLNGQVKAGDRFPWFTLWDRQDIYARLSPARFTLFALGGAAEQDLKSLRSPLLDVVAVSDRGAYARTGLSDGLYLVRPDGYLGLCARKPEEVRVYLSEVVGLKPPYTAVETLK